MHDPTATASGADPSPLADTGVFVDVNSTATIRHNIFEKLNIGVNCYGCSDSSIEDNTFQNIVGAANASTGYGTLASNAGARVKILHNRYLGQSVMRHGIYDSSGHSFDDIEDNYVENTILDCITVYAVATQRQSVEIKIVHNELHACAQANVATAAGIGLYGYHARVTVTDNRINGSRGTCINEDGLPGDATHRGEKNIISSNRCSEAAFHGISLGGVFDDQVTGNYVFNSGQQTPNTYSSIRLTAVALNGRAVPGAPANNRIRGNSLSGGQIAYAVDDQADHPGIVNEVTNNTAAPGSRGSVNNANKSLILSGNTIKSSDMPEAAP